MPHTFLKRHRQAAVGIDQRRLVTHFVWEAVNATFYLMGAMFFIVGNIYSLPNHTDAAFGTWIKVAASLLYLTVSLHDLVEVVLHSTNEHHKNHSDVVKENGGESDGSVNIHNHWWDMFAAIAYALGALLFIYGSVNFLPSYTKLVEGACAYIVGSLMFMIGSLFNALQIFEADSVWVARNLNIVAASFMVGSNMFMVGSIPYLIPLESSTDRRRLEYFSVGTFIVAGGFFWVGGAVNLWRSSMVLRQDLLEIRKSAPDSVPAKLIARAAEALRIDQGDFYRYGSFASTGDPA